ncbi:MAG: Thiol:disulfide interchange protein DsbD [Rhodocyclaceae bacterium]|nr:Thiol:disulfide interchange protein DsbD [Rhodocyclaceae bacterium]
MGRVLMRALGMGLVLWLGLIWMAPADAEELLAPEQAFRVSARSLDAQTLAVRFEIAPGYYLYRDKFGFAAQPPASLGEAALPAGTLKDDALFGKVETYRNAVEVTLAVAGAEAGRVRLTASYQGCADIGVCYPPQKSEFDLVLSAASTPPADGPAMSSPSNPAAASAAALQTLGSDTDEAGRFAASLAGAGLGWVLLGFFVAGLALSATPCTLPMIPIISGIIVQHGHAISRGRALALTAFYVFGMAVTYAVAGVIAAQIGSLLVAFLQNPWVLGAYALVFVALAASMFGLFELQLPSSWQNRLSGIANRRGGSATALFTMGALSALIAGPCVAAPLAGALLYIARSGDLVSGGLALFVLALGMGTPLLLVGYAARGLLPQPGPWMTAVNRGFGFALLAVALWLVQPLLPASAQMLAWAALLITIAVFLHALEPLPARAHGLLRLGKGVGIIALVAGISLLIGVAAGSRDPLQPLAILKSAASADTPGPAFRPVADLAGLDAALANPGRPVLLDVYADWCVSCKELERYTFADPRVRARMERMLLLRADVTANNAADRALLRRLGLFGPPGVLLFDAQGVEIPGARTVGFQNADDFLRTLASVGD